MPVGEPTTRRKRLGSVLRRLRVQAGLTQEQAGDAVGKDATFLSRIEAGRQKIDIPLVWGLLDVYAVSDPAVREALEAMARTIGQRGWWHTYRSYLATAHQDFFGFESDAAGVEKWETMLIPGLLQTTAYTRALLTQGEGSLYTDPAQLDARVEVRMSRKMVLDRETFRYEAIISEAALSGGPKDAQVMRGQLEHLLAESERPNISLRVLPLDSDFHLGMDGAFAIIRFPDGGRLVSLESLVNTMYLEDEPTLDVYATAWQRLTDLALTEPRTRDAIREHMRDR